MEARRNRDAIAHERKDLESYQRALDVQWLNNRMEEGRVDRCLARMEKEEMEKEVEREQNGQGGESAERSAERQHESDRRSHADEQQRAYQHKKEESARTHDEMVYYQTERREDIQRKKDVVDQEDRKRAQLSQASDDRRQAAAYQHEKEETERMHDEMVYYQSERRDDRQREKENLMQEERVRQQYHVSQERNDVIVDERDRKIHEREGHSQVLGEQLLADGVIRQNRDDVVTANQNQECFDRNERDDESARERTRARRADINDSYALQMSYKEAAAAEARAVEGHFQDQRTRICALEDEREAKREQLKKERNHQYSLDLQEQIAGNAARRKAEKEADQALARKDYERDDAWRTTKSVRETAHAAVVEAQEGNNLPGLMGYGNDEEPVTRRGGGDTGEEEEEGEGEKGGKEAEELAAGVEGWHMTDKSHRITRSNDEVKILRDY